MLGLKGPTVDCPIQDGQCLAWASKYLMDCVCDIWDEISLALGLLSVFAWGLAEVPQIITNFREKSTEGVSLAFLMTWVVGDAFNLAGCYLEPATLPTQFYMALLYTLTTIILVGQTIYYDHLRPNLFPSAGFAEEPEGDEAAQKAAAAATAPTAKVGVEGAVDTSRPVKGTTSTSPGAESPSLSSTINVPHARRSSSRDLYYMSARSLASSHTPTIGSYLVGSAGSGEHTQSFLRPSGRGSGVPQERSSVSPVGSASSNSGGAGGGALARAAAAASLLMMGSVGLTSTYLSGGSFGFSQAGRGRVFLGSTGRRLLQGRMPNYLREAEWEGPWGEVFGWIMAGIYMGGRLPQILLNIRRGTVEGLNPLMFIFALIGNATYVGSILMRTLDWTLIKPNMPWLVDAGVCVLLDCFIICQFVYYASRVKGKDVGKEVDDKQGNYELVR